MVNIQSATAENRRGKKKKRKIRKKKETTAAKNNGLPYWAAIRRRTIKTLGVTLYQNLTLNKHVSSLSRNIHFHARALRVTLGLS